MKHKQDSTPKLLTSLSKEEFSHEQIALAAYRIWEQEGRPKGRDLDHWLRGQDLLRQNRKQPQLPRP